MRSLALLLRYYRAERALAENGIAEYELGIRYETPEFLRLNEESFAADAALDARLRRPSLLIDWWIARRLRYWRRTGQK